jgi:hypothetical protein
MTGRLTTRPRHAPSWRETPASTTTMPALATATMMTTTKKVMKRTMMTTGSAV